MRGPWERRRARPGAASPRPQRSAGFSACFGVVEAADRALHRAGREMHVAPGEHREITDWHELDVLEGEPGYPDRRARRIPDREFHGVKSSGGWFGVRFETGARELDRGGYSGREAGVSHERTIEELRTRLLAHPYDTTANEAAFAEAMRVPGAQRAVLGLADDTNREALVFDPLTEAELHALVSPYMLDPEEGAGFVGSIASYLDRYDRAKSWDLWVPALVGCLALALDSYQHCVLHVLGRMIERRGAPAPEVVEAVLAACERDPQGARAFFQFAPDPRALPYLVRELFKGAAEAVEALRRLDLAPGVVAPAIRQALAAATGFVYNREDIENYLSELEFDAPPDGTPKASAYLMREFVRRCDAARTLRALEVGGPLDVWPPLLLQLVVLYLYGHRETPPEHRLHRSEPPRRKFQDAVTIARRLLDLGANPKAKLGTRGSWWFAEERLGLGSLSPKITAITTLEAALAGEGEFAEFGPPEAEVRALLESLAPPKQAKPKDGAKKAEKRAKPRGAEEPAPVEPQFPPLLDAATEEQALTRLRADKRFYALLEKAGSGATEGEVAWNLLANRKLRGADIKRAWGFLTMGESEVDPAWVIAFARRYEDALGPGVTEALPGLADFVVRWVGASRKAHPEAWAAAMPTLPARIRDALHLAALREAPPEDSERLRAELANHLRLYSRRDALCLGDTPEQWGRRVVHHLERPGIPDSLGEIFDGARFVSFARFAELVLAAEPNVADALLQCCMDRADDAESLMSLAEQLRERAMLNDHAKASRAEALAALLTAVARTAPSWVLPESWDRWLVDEVLVLGWRFLSPSSRCMARLSSVLERMPRARALSLLDAARERSAHVRYGVYPLYAVVWSEETGRALVEDVREILRTSTNRVDDAPAILGRLGARTIPIFEALLAEELARNEVDASDYQVCKVRAGLRKGIVAAIATELQAGRTVAPETLRHLDPGPEVIDWQIVELMFHGSFLTEAIAALPEAEARALVTAWCEHDARDRMGVRRYLRAMLPAALLATLAPEEAPAGVLRRLAAETGLPLDTRVYVLEERAEGAGPLARIGADRLALAPERVPRFRDRPMQHVITFDLAEIPELRAVMQAPAARALAVFVSRRDSNGADQPGSGRTAVLALSETEAVPVGGEPYTATAVDVPAAVFGKIRKKDQALLDLRAGLKVLPGRVLGAPLWLQDEVDALPPFVAQLEHRFVHVNCGDEGELYVFVDDAFWQSH